MSSESDVALLAQKIDRLCDCIDELIGSNTQLLDEVVQSQEDEQEAPGPVYLDEFPENGSSV